MHEAISLVTSAVQPAEIAVSCNALQLVAGCCSALCTNHV